MAVGKYTTAVEFVKNETPTVYTVRLRFKPVDAFSFLPGQYIMVRIPKDGKIINKPYSLASIPSEKGYVDLCIKLVKGGFISNYMHYLKPGEKVEIMGPMGIFILREPIERDILFIAGGSGIGPLRCMIKEIFRKGTKQEIWLFFGNKTEDEIIYREEFELLAREHKNFHFIPVLSRQDWNGKNGYAQDAWQNMMPNVADKEAYICGLTRLVEDNKKLLLEKGMPKEFVHHEIYV